MKSASYKKRFLITLLMLPISTIKKIPKKVWIMIAFAWVVVFIDRNEEWRDFVVQVGVWPIGLSDLVDICVLAATLLMTGSTMVRASEKPEGNLYTMLGSEVGMVFCLAILAFYIGWLDMDTLNVNAKVTLWIMTALVGYAAMMRMVIMSNSQARMYGTQVSRK